jgi:hypothetical protein
VTTKSDSALPSRRAAVHLRCQLAAFLTLAPAIIPSSSPFLNHHFLRFLATRSGTLARFGKAAIAHNTVYKGIRCKDCWHAAPQGTLREQSPNFAAPRPRSPTGLRVFMTPGLEQMASGHDLNARLPAEVTAKTPTDSISATDGNGPNCPILIVLLFAPPASVAAGALNIRWQPGCLERSVGISMRTIKPMINGAESSSWAKWKVKHDYLWGEALLFPIRW